MTIPASKKFAAGASPCSVAQASMKAARLRGNGSASIRARSSAASCNSLSIGLFRPEPRNPALRANSAMPSPII
jgi:hypothetical protein